MRRNPCGWFQARLPLLAGDDLVGPERRDVERHLVGCLGCRQHLESLQGAINVLHATASVPSIATLNPQSLWPALDRQIRESRRTVPAWPRLVALPIAGLAASVLIAVGVLALTHPLASKHNGQTIADKSSPTASPPVEVPNDVQTKPQDGSSDAQQVIRASTEPTFRGHVSAQPDPNEAQPTR